MKTKNKKHYNFTEKQKRKDSSVGRDLPPAHFRKMFNDEFTAKCKQALIDKMAGKDVEFPRFRKSIGWYYW